MQQNVQRLIEAVPAARNILVLPTVALDTVTAKNQSAVYASADVLFRDAIFGRDSLEVAEDLMTIKPKLVHNILLTLGRLQGMTINPMNEEEPGKIIHEYRTKRINGRLIGSKQQRILHELAEKWGGTDDELAYYGSIDATPHFLRTLGAYCLVHGDAILQESVQGRDGETMTMREVAQSATNWLGDTLRKSKSGLLEYHRVNPRGIENQVWKDSAEFYVHDTGEGAPGEMANHSAPIASIEVQALAYDGLLAAARFFPGGAPEYTELAETLRDRTIDLLWDDGSRYFMLGTDYDAADQLRRIRTRSANAAALLDSGFFDRLPRAEQRKYVGGIVSTIMGEDFLTNAGIRSRALSAGHLVDHWDYHGSFVTWPKETYDIAKGLRRWHMPKLARQLENRLLNVVRRHFEYPEFVYVDEMGQVLGGAPSSQTHGSVLVIKGVNTPERIQAWTVSAVYAILVRRILEKGRKPKAQQEPWQAELEAGIMSRIRHMDRHLNPFTIRKHYPKRPWRHIGITPGI